MSKKNIYVVSGGKYGSDEPIVLATYSNFKSAVAYAKYFVGDDPIVNKGEDITFVHGVYGHAHIEPFPLKKEFDND